MTAPVWPLRGRCGACGRAALRFPSGRWQHIGRPCRAESQTVWAVDDAALVRCTHRFIPDGQDLPPSSDGWRAWMRGESGTT